MINDIISKRRLIQTSIRGGIKNPNRVFANVQVFVLCAIDEVGL